MENPPLSSLRELNVDDAAFALRLTTDDEWLRFIGDRGVTDIASAKDFILNRIRPAYLKPNMGLMGIVDEATQALVGVCGLLQREYLSQPDLGFALLPEARGNGFVQAAAKQCIARAASSGINTLFAITTMDNQASQSSLLKLGFRADGVITVEDETLQRFVLRV